MTALADLIARVEAATGPDDAIDKELWLLDRDTPVHRLSASISKMRPSQTGRFEAALGLADRVLPEYGGLMLFEAEGEWGAHWQRPATDTAYGPTPALALVLAILRAKQSEAQP